MAGFYVRHSYKHLRVALARGISVFLPIAHKPVTSRKDVILSGIPGTIDTFLRFFYFYFIRKNFMLTAYRGRSRGSVPTNISLSREAAEILEQHSHGQKGKMLSRLLFEYQAKLDERQRIAASLVSADVAS